jgi:hypothetical protein
VKGAEGEVREGARPDDWHLHLRDGAVLAAVLPDTARQFARAIVMPNLKPPVTTPRWRHRGVSRAASSPRVRRARTSRR